MVAGRQASAPPQLKLGSDGRTAVSGPLWAQVDLSGIRVERVHDFGEVYPALSLWRRVGLDELLAGLIEPGREKVEWEQVACLFCRSKTVAKSASESSPNPTVPWPNYSTGSE